METSEEDLYFQKINELVLDEDKIITCPSIACELKVPLVQAQEILCKYLKDQRDLQPGQFGVTYLLSGSLKNDQGLQVHLVKEEDLGQKKQTFENIASELIYSIQKCKIVNENALSLVDPNVESNLNLINVPVSKNCIKRNLRVKRIVVVPQSKPSTSKSSQNPVQAMFKNVQPKKEEIKEEKKTNGNHSQKQITNKPKSGGIANFFSKDSQPVKHNTETVKPVVKDENNITDSKENCVNEINVVDETEKMEVDEVFDASPVVKKEKLPTENDKKGNGNKKRKKTTTNSDAPNKKRKRIQQIIDSDSSDMFDEDDDENIIEKSDDELPPPQPPEKIVEKLKNRHRKAIDKTYMDEEGFIVTTTEYVYESGTDEEEKGEKKVVEEKPKAMVPEKKPSTTDSENDSKTSTQGKGRKKNNKKPVSGKQPTLMSFFKKS